MHKVIHIEYKFKRSFAVKVYTTNGLFIGINGVWL